MVDTPVKMQDLLARAGFDEVRSWEADLTSTIDAEHLIRLRTELGSSKPRFDSLGPDAARACIDEARQRMARLTPDGFVARCRVVHAIAHVRART